MSTCVEFSTGESEKTCEVVVVGGGPAGSAAACAAARQGLQTVLVESGRKGRDKACGDMFAPTAVTLLQELGLCCEVLAQAQEARTFDALELRSPRGLLWKVMYPEQPVWIIPRKISDQKLRDLLPANVGVMYEASVRTVAKLPRGFLSVTACRQDGKAVNLQCRAVVLAAGAQDRLSDQWGISGRRLHAPSISAYARCTGVTMPAFEFLSACRPGYRWAFPAPDGYVNFGICALTSTRGSRLKSLGRDLWDAYGISGEPRWRGGTGGLWSSDGVRWHHDAGLVSCGDAAGLVDPVNGEGLTAALASGRAAGEAAARFVLGNGDAGVLRSYSEWVKAYFGSRYAPSAVRTAWKQLCGITSEHRSSSSSAYQCAIL
jgi:flavin-dependent dehydrogenase